MALLGEEVVERAPNDLHIELQAIMVTSAYTFGSQLGAHRRPDSRIIRELIVRGMLKTTSAQRLR